MTSANISQLGAKVQTANTAKGNVDTSKGNEEAQAVFATMMSQVNFNSGNANVVKDRTEVTGSDGSTEVKASGRSEQASLDNYSSEKAERIPKAPSAADAKRTEVQEKVEESYDELSTEIYKVIEDNLMVSEEEIQKVLDTLDIDVVELISPEQLLEAVELLTGVEDSSQLLLRDDFANVMSAMAEVSQNLTENLDVSREELQNVIQQVVGNDEMESVLNTGAEAVDVMIQPDTEGLNLALEVEDMSAQQVLIQDETAVREPVPQGENQEVVQAETMPVEEGTVAGGGKEQTSEQDSMMQNQTEEEYVPEHTSTVKEETTSFDKNVLFANVNSQAVQSGEDVTSVGNMEQIPESRIHVEEVMQQIAEHIRVSVTSETSNIEMQLNPQNLGKVFLHLSATKEGEVTAQFMAQNENVKQTLEVQMVELRQNLLQQGVKVNAIEVTVASHEYERNLEQNMQGEQQQGQEQPRQQGRRGLRIDSLEDLSGLMTEEELMAAKIMRDNGNSMDVTA